MVSVPDCFFSRSIVLLKLVRPFTVVPREGRAHRRALDEADERQGDGRHDEGRDVGQRR